jgi:hypothetical protein
LKQRERCDTVVLLLSCLRLAYSATVGPTLNLKDRKRSKIQNVLLLHLLEDEMSVQINMVLQHNMSKETLKRTQE